ncbi:MAG: C25 family cysteine peptidase [Thermoanaerobaculia bacterium]|nr:C25 family cysteine peptidase [Thermoanaerobaculia bacterium]
MSSDADPDGLSDLLPQGERLSMSAPPKNPETLSAIVEHFSERPTVFALGVDMQTGGYHRPPMTSGSYAWALSGKAVRAGGGKEPRAGVDPDNLAQAGWGVIIADEAAREPLKPLLDLRRQQAGARYTEYAFEPGQSAQSFLSRQNTPPGPADPEHGAPYYLTVVGDPNQLSFEFQQQLDIRHAVGRICFEQADDYARYAAAVVASEGRETIRSRSAVLLGVEHENDPATKLCNKRLVEPLAQTVMQQPGWRAQIVTGPAASHQTLTELLQSPEKPALILTSGHGLVLPGDHEMQRRLQGALLTAEWPGPGTEKVNPQQLFSADDLSGSTDVAGLIAVLFGCFTAGTPRYDAFAEGQRNELASQPFVADFPKRLLARGALAAIGHVDSLYIHSFAWPGIAAGPQHQTFERLFFDLMRGRRLGHAMDVMGRRYAQLAALLLAARLDPGQVSEREYASYWIGYHDARQYIVLGDPAVRLSVSATA